MFNTIPKFKHGLNNVNIVGISSQFRHATVIMSINWSGVMGVTEVTQPIQILG